MVDWYRVTLPRVLNQGRRPSCISYAIAALAEHYIHQKGHNERVDEVKLYNETERGGVANEYRVLEHMRTKGVPTVSGKRYLLREWGPVARTPYSIKKALDQFGGLILSYHLFDRDPFTKRLNKKWELTREPMDTHAMVITGYDNNTKFYRIQNSWGKEWGDKGFFYIPFVLMRRPYVEQILYFKLK